MEYIIKVGKIFVRFHCNEEECKIKRGDFETMVFELSRFKPLLNAYKCEENGRCMEVS